MRNHSTAKVAVMMPIERGERSMPTDECAGERTRERERAAGQKERKEMPFKDTLTLGSSREPAVNLHFSVGISGDNGPADVTLIQAMFHFLCREDAAMENVGLTPDEVPEITGRCCDRTRNAIYKFQRRNADRLPRANGLIEPARYRENELRCDAGSTTMSCLHSLCAEAADTRRETHYIDALIGVAPQLRPWLA